MARGIETRSAGGMALAIATTLGMAAEAGAASPTYYMDEMTFQAELLVSVTDPYEDPGYIFIQNNAAMSGVLGETDYESTGFNNHNIITNMGADPRYCAGCNGSFQLSFLTTTVGTPGGVSGVGLHIETHSMATPYYAYITFGDGTMADIALPPAGSYWGVTAPELIESIHFGLSMGGTTTSGSFAIDDLTVGTGQVPGCEEDADCFDDGDPCTDPVCIMGLCDFAFNVAPCDDGNICTEMDVCALGVCDGAPVSCDDGNPCTNEFCEPGAGCINQLNSDPCDDGNICTEMDTCSMGVCVGADIDCSDGDACSIDSCDPMMGCINEPAMGCCDSDDDCGEEEVCDLGQNACVPAGGAEESSGGSEEDTGGDETTGGETGMAETSAGGTGGGDSGIADSGLEVTGVLETGGDDDDGGTGTTSLGELPDVPSGCACTSSAAAPSRDREWWLGLLVLGLGVRRRRARG